MKFLKQSDVMTPTNGKDKKIMAITEEQVIQKANEMIEKTAEQMKELVDKVLRSGAFNIDYYENNFVLPHIIVHVAFQEARCQNAPRSPEEASDSKNLSIFF